MRDVNHQVSKALVNRQSKPTLFALKPRGVRSATEKARKGDRYVQAAGVLPARQMLNTRPQKPVILLLWWTCATRVKPA